MLRLRWRLCEADREIVLEARFLWAWKTVPSLVSLILVLFFFAATRLNRTPKYRNMMLVELLFLLIFFKSPLKEHLFSRASHVKNFTTNTVVSNIINSGNNAGQSKGIFNASEAIVSLVKCRTILQKAFKS